MTVMSNLGEISNYVKKIRRFAYAKQHWDAASKPNFNILMLKFHLRKICEKFPSCCQLGVPDRDPNLFHCIISGNILHVDRGVEGEVE